MKNTSLWKKYAYAWVTIAFFLFSLVGHWLFGWYAFVQEAQEHGQEPEVAQYTIQMMRDTFENWQSEFLQLIWQVAGLAYLLYLGSPQSKEGDERFEEKLDKILRSVAKDGDETIKKLDRKYGRG